MTLHRTTLLMSALIVLTASGGGQGGLSARRSRRVTESDAIRMVQAFEQNPLLRPFVSYGPWSPGRPQDGGRYELRADPFVYTVDDSTTTRIQRRNERFSLHRDDFYGQPYDPKSLAEQTMSESAISGIARRFMESHFPHPNVLNALDTQAHKRYDYPAGAIEPIEFLDYYHFTFLQKLNNGARSSSECVVDVDTVRGEVVWYSHHDYPSPHSVTPRLSADQAMAAAMRRVGADSANPYAGTRLIAGPPDDLGQAVLLYHVSFYATRRESRDAKLYEATVDANSGFTYFWSIVHTSDYPKQARLLAAASKGQTPTVLGTSISNRKITLAYPPILWNGRPYLYIGYLCYPRQRAEPLRSSSGRLVLRASAGQVVIDPNSRRYTVNGQPRKMERLPLRVAGLCYVPLDVVKAVMPFRTRYDAGSRVVAFDPL